MAREIGTKSMAAGWNAAKVKAFRAAFMEFIKHVYIDSKDTGGKTTLGDRLFGAQKRFLDCVFDGLANDIHDFKILKSRQLGISTLSRALSLFWLGMHPGLKGAMVFDTNPHRDEARNEFVTMLKNLPDHLGFPKLVKDGRDLLSLDNDSTLVFLSAGVRQSKASGTLGRSSGLNFVHACMAPGTPVIVGDGVVKAIEDVSVGDTVITHTGAKAKVIANEGQRNTKKVMRRISVWRGEPILCTADHKIPTQRGMVLAGDLTKDDLLIMPIRKIRHTHKGSKLPITSSRLQGGGCASAGSGSSLVFSEEFGFAIGYYLAEGCMTYQRRGADYGKNPSGIIFARHPSEKAYADRAITALRMYTTGSRRTNQQKGTLTTTEAIYGSSLATWVKAHFGAADTKRIPDEVFSWGEDFCKGLLAGLLCGDGSKTIAKGQGYTTNRVSLSTIRSSFATQIRDIAASLGYGWSSIRHRPAGTRCGRNCKEIWVVDWSGTAAAGLRSLMGLSPCLSKRTWVEKTKIEGSKVFVRIRNIEDDVPVPVMYDLSVDHKDHTFRTLSFSTSNSEMCSWQNEEGVVSFRNSLSENFPNRLYIWESTARGFNQWYRMWLEAKVDNLNQRTCFIGWWAKDSQVIAKNTPMFERYGEEPPTEDEVTKIVEVKEKYGHVVTAEQLAWYRRKSNPSMGADNAEETGADELEELMQQEQPWCVTRDTRVGTNKGMLRIEDVVAGMQATRGEVLHAGPTGRARIWRATTKLGYQIRGTGNHPLINIDHEEVRIDKSLGSKVKLQPPIFASRTYTHRWRDGCVDCAVEITPDFARLVGLFMGDGSAWGQANAANKNQYTIQITCDDKDQDVIEECQRLFRQCFGKDPILHKGKGNWTDVRLCSRTAIESFWSLGLLRNDTGKTQRKVHVPEFIWRSPKEVVREFLTGLFEADGFNAYNQHRVAFFSKYAEFLREVQLLLLAFGITSRGCYGLKKHTADHEYAGNQIELRASESLAFNETIGFISRRKRERHLHPNFKQSGNKTKRVYQRLAITFEDEIVSVVDEGVVEEVFNLTVANDHLFDANGILTHNTEEDAFLQSGSTFFANDRLTEITKQDVSEKYDAYYFSQGSDFLECDWKPAVRKKDAQLKVWEEPDPDGIYILACDPAFGHDESNNNSAVQVLRAYADCLEQVAEYAYSGINTEPFAWVIASLAGWYKFSYVMLEINGPGEAVWLALKELKKLVMTGHMRAQAIEKGLRDIFVNVRDYMYARSDSTAGPGGTLHWKTTGSNKVGLMERLRDMVANRSLITRSGETVDEMKTIVRNGDVIAAEGRNRDDRTFCLAMGVRVWTDSVRRMMSISGRTKDNEIAKKRLTVKDQINLFNKHKLDSFFKTKQSSRAAELAQARRSNWRNK